MIIPIRSSTTGKYDPWTDLNDDGTVDIYDAISLANTFGTSGDPTKNVNVANWPVMMETKPATQSLRYVYVNPDFNVISVYELLPPIETKGYRRIYFSLRGNCNFTIGWRTQGAFNSSQWWWGQIDYFEEFENWTQQTGLSYIWREFDVKGETMVVWLGDAFYTQYFDVSYYLTA
jgi:hypothetical protein